MKKKIKLEANRASSSIEFKHFYFRLFVLQANTSLPKSFKTGMQSYYTKTSNFSSKLRNCKIRLNEKSCTSLLYNFQLTKMHKFFMQYFVDESCKLKEKLATNKKLALKKSLMRLCEFEPSFCLMQRHFYTRKKVA